VTYINEAGLETVAQAKLVTGEYAPLIAADAERLEGVMEAAHDIAKAKNLKMRLIKFTRTSPHEWDFGNSPASALSVARKLPASPMTIFALRIENAFNVAV
jgi:hypothetical protein